MKKSLNKFHAFLLHNTVWIFITVIFLIAFAKNLVLFLENTDSVVYIADEKWFLYLEYAVSLILIFSPLLIFTALRTSLLQLLPTWLYQFLWLYSFAIHPIFMAHLEVNQYFSSLSFPSEILLIFALILLGIELLIQLNDFFTSKFSMPNRFKAMNLEQAILLLLTFISVVFAILTTYILMERGNNRYGIVLSFLIRFAKFFSFSILCYAFYLINRYVLFEKVFQQKGLLHYCFSLVSLTLIFYPLFCLSAEYLLIGSKWHIGPQLWIPKGERQTAFTAVNIEFPLLYMFISLPVILVHQWWKQKNEITRLAQEKTNAELRALKEQVNPHFLFNTLNTLYALGIEEKSEKTANGIAQLGLLMRYNLHDAHHQQIALAKELAYIQKYIALQKLRLTENNQLSIDLPNKNIEDFQIAPMLLMPFIENAFKFSLSPSEATFIKVRVTLKKNILNMHVINSILRKKQSISSTGIGIENVKKRLALLYPDQHEVIIEQEPAIFKAFLKIELTNPK